ncbi:MAG: C40 family peptidase [Thermoflexibacteraceae bacterium]
MNKTYLNLFSLLLCGVVFSMTSCSTVNPMMSYTSASIEVAKTKVATQKTQSFYQKQIETLAPLPVLKVQSLKALTPNLTNTTTFNLSLLPSPHTLDIGELYIPAPADPLQALKDSMVEYAKQYIGVRYRHGGKSPKGFDCSGFTSYVMDKFGVKVSPSSRHQAEEGELVNADEVQKGDLIFFGNKDKKGRYRINHAALVISEKGEPLAFIHAARRGITIDEEGNTNWRSYYKKRFVKARRVLATPTTTDEVVLEAPAAPRTTNDGCPD